MVRKMGQPYDEREYRRDPETGEMLNTTIMWEKPVIPFKPAVNCLSRWISDRTFPQFPGDIRVTGDLIIPIA